MTLTIELPEEILSALGQSADEAEKDARLAVAIEWYRRGAVSQGRAAEIAGVPRADFIDELAARKIDVVEVDLEELKRELGIVNDRVQLLSSG
jgi:predicted HTH domain antitoxin